MFVHDERENASAWSQFEESRVKTIPAPKKLKREFLTAFSLWKSSCGLDWAVSRTKQLRDYILQCYSGNSVSPPEWFATTRSGNLKGLPRKLLRYALTGPRQLKAILFLLSRITLEIHSEKEVDITSIFRSTSGQPRCSVSDADLRKIYPALSKIRITSKDDVFTTGKAYPIFKHVACSAPVPLFQVPPKLGQVKRVPFDLEVAFNSEFWRENDILLKQAVGFDPWSLVTRDPDFLSEAVWDPEPFTHFALMGGYGPIPHITLVGNSNERRVSGSINVHLQNGPKDRYFFAPFLPFQRALDPLKEQLALVAKGLPWDCTHNQRKADMEVRKAFSEGREVFSVDLHAATDNFPWQYQKCVLNGLIDGRQWIKGKKNWAPLMRDFLVSLVETGSLIWETEDGFSVYPPFSKGQPLGLGPSFFLFTISHGLLLFILNGQKWDHDFFVCGDDVLIFRKELHDAYRKVLQKWSVPISDLKSFQSKRIAQFTGVTFADDQQFWVPKWYKPEKGNLLDLAAYWYPGLTDRMKDGKLIKRILSLPEPFGNGWNSEGKSFDDRLPVDLIDLIESSRRKNKLNTVVPRGTYISTAHVSVLLKNEIDPSYLGELMLRLEEDPLIFPVLNTSGVSVTTEKMLETFANDKFYDFVRVHDGGSWNAWPPSRTRVGDRYSFGRLQSWKKLFSDYEAIVVTGSPLSLDGMPSNTVKLS